MIAAKTWREIRVLTLLYVFLLQSGVAVSIWLWPWLRDQSPALARLAPAAFIRRWVEGITNPDASAAYNAYMALQLFFKGANIVGLAFAVVFGALAIAREREGNTLELLMSRPVTRTRILMAKSWVLAAALIVPIFVTTWSAIPLSWMIDEQLPFYELTLAAAHNALFCSMFLAASLACSVWFRTQLMVVAAVGGVGVFQVGIYFVQEIRVASLFRLSDYDVYAPILAGNLPLGPLFLGRGVWILLATFALFGAAVASFRRAEP